MTTYMHVIMQKLLENNELPVTTEYSYNPATVTFSEVHV